MREPSVDPVLVEVIRGALGAMAEEMGIAVVRGAYSTAVKEGADVSGAVFDRRGRLVAHSDSTLIAHVGSLRASIREVLADFPLDEIRDGDLFFMNDPYRGGVHSNDIEVFRAVGFGGSVEFFTGTLVHVADLGGISAGGTPGIATDMFQEGLVLPPLRLGAGGEPDAQMVKLIRANSRAPQKVIGDLLALIGGVNTGARRLAELAARFTVPAIISAADALIDYTERRTRAAISALPRGEYIGSATIDDDGVLVGAPLTVRVRLATDGDTLVLDFSATDPQAKGAINASYAQATSTALFGSRVVLDDPDVPINEGAFAPLRIELGSGTLCNPNWPAAVNARGVTMMAMLEALFAALSQQQPGRSAAGSSINHVATVSTFDPSMRQYRLFVDNDYGGVGARASKDGLDGSGQGILGGRTFTVPIEGVEQEHPVVYECYRLRADSGGAGRFRGGLGLERTMRVLSDATVSIRADKQTHPPAGLAGGRDGAPTSWVINAGRDGEVQLPSKATNVALRAGDTLTMLSPGGGGYGSPTERAAAAVLADVVEGRVSLAAARDVYGVVINDATGGQFSIDDGATARARARMKEA